MQKYYFRLSWESMALNVIDKVTVNLTYSIGTDRPNELCYNFSISNDLTQMVNFSTQIT